MIFFYSIIFPLIALPKVIFMTFQFCVVFSILSAKVKGKGLTHTYSQVLVNVYFVSIRPTLSKDFHIFRYYMITVQHVQLQIYDITA